MILFCTSRPSPCFCFRFLFALNFLNSEILRASVFLSFSASPNSPLSAFLLFSSSTTHIRLAFSFNSPLPGTGVFFFAFAFFVRLSWFSPPNGSPTLLIQDATRLDWFPRLFSLRLHPPETVHRKFSEKWQIVFFGPIRHLLLNSTSQNLFFRWKFFLWAFLTSSTFVPFLCGAAPFHFERNNPSPRKWL